MLTAGERGEYFQREDVSGVGKALASEYNSEVEEGNIGTTHKPAKDIRDGRRMCQSD